MQSIHVRLAHAAYEVIVGVGVFEKLEEHLRRAGLGGPFLIVSQPRIFRAVGKDLSKKFPIVLIPDGERAKTLTTVSRLLDRMVELKLTRQSTVIAVGGGVVGDVAGFAASIYMRGIAVVQVPTTLLAQVDSSIGGKTGVNHRVAKNLIGSFYQPRLVLSDPLVLQKLPDREYASGLYEALKYGIIRDATLFEDFERDVATFLKRDPEALERLVAKCAAIKAHVVMSDEKENDIRRVLNLGHTVGHGLEAAAKYQRIKHGEAVGYGMIAAARISTALEKLALADRERIEAAIRSIGRLPALSGVNSKFILDALQHDKKIRDGAVHFILPRKIGCVEITPGVPLNIVREVVKGILDEGKRVPGPG
ncbi:MAG: 3-dehydroquinate synthase [Acidobacteria bacterium]|nr:MAG: 3-dehydroquinate synthase [Acidobacteriota bacterium]